jgi:cytochrome c biogenesis protein CcmG/thiol:disulfide interchange protein DsbE
MADRRRGATLLVAGVLLAAACATGGTTTGEDTATSPGTTPVAGAATVPDVEVEDFDGATVSLGDHTGTPLVVNFWASWCPPCIAEMPDLEAVHQLAGDRVRFLGVNTQDTPQRATELVADTGVTYDLVRDPDGELFRAFEVFGMPSTFYVAPDGTIVGRHTGLLTREALVDDLAEHLGVELP